MTFLRRSVVTVTVTASLAISILHLPPQSKDYFFCSFVPSFFDGVSKKVADRFVKFWKVFLGRGAVNYMALVWSTILRVLCPLIFAVMSRGETAEDTT